MSEEKTKTSKKYFRGVRAINLAYSDEAIQAIANRLADSILAEKKAKSENQGDKKE